MLEFLAISGNELKACCLRARHRLLALSDSRPDVDHMDLVLSAVEESQTTAAADSSGTGHDAWFSSRPADALVNFYRSGLAH